MLNALDPDTVRILLQIHFPQCAVLLTDRTVLCGFLRAHRRELLHLRFDLLIEDGLSADERFQVCILLRELLLPRIAGFEQLCELCFDLRDPVIAVADLRLADRNACGHTRILLLRSDDLVLERFDIHSCLLHILKGERELFLTAFQIALQILIFRRELQIVIRERLQLRRLFAEPVDPERDLQLFALRRQHQIFLRLFRLRFQRPDAAFQLCGDIGQAHEIVLCLRELALRLLLAVAEFGDTCRLLENIAALIRFCTDDLRDSALSDDCIAVSAEAGVHEQLVDILQADIPAVDEILAVAAAVEPPRDRDLRLRFGQRMVTVVDRQRHSGKAHLLALRRTGKDDILHALAAQLLRGLLAQHPADGIADIALAAAVRSDDGGEALVKGQRDLVGE